MLYKITIGEKRYRGDYGDSSYCLLLEKDFSLKKEYIIILEEKILEKLIEIWSHDSKVIYNVEKYNEGDTI